MSEIELDNLQASIDCLTQKLDGIGLEIYHLTSAIGSLANAVRELKKED